MQDNHGLRTGYPVDGVCHLLHLKLPCCPQLDQCTDLVAARLDLFLGLSDMVMQRFDALQQL